MSSWRFGRIARADETVEAIDWLVAHTPAEGLESCEFDGWRLVEVVGSTTFDADPLVGCGGSDRYLYFVDTDSMAWSIGVVVNGAVAGEVSGVADPELAAMFPTTQPGGSGAFVEACIDFGLVVKQQAVEEAIAEQSDISEVAAQLGLPDGIVTLL